MSAHWPSICIFPIHTVKVLSKKFLLGGMFIPSTCWKECFFNEKSWHMRRVARLFEKKLDMFFMLVEALLARASYFRPHRQRYSLFVSCMVTPLEQGHYWNKNPLSASRILNKTRRQCISKSEMPLVQRYEGNSILRNALPWHGMPFVQRYEGNSVFRNALPSHFTL